MKNVYIIASSVIKDAARKKIFYVVFLFAIALVALSPMLPTLEESFRTRILLEVSLSMTSLFALVLTLILSVTQITGEIENKTIYNLFSKPLSRLQYFLGKYLGIIATLAIILLVMGLEVLILVLIRLNELTPSLFIGVLAILLECSVVAAFCIFISTMTKPAVSITITILFYFLCHMKSSFLHEKIVQGGTGALAVIYYPLYYIFPNLENFNVLRQISAGEGVPVWLFIELVLYATGFVVLMATTAYFIFRSKDI